MENLKWPAFPLEHKITDYCAGELGLTKLEYAALLIAQGLATHRDQHDQPYYDPLTLAKESVIIASHVISEANK
jgi:hypothetical protein